MTQPRIVALVCLLFAGAATAQKPVAPVTDPAQRKATVGKAKVPRGPTPTLPAECLKLPAVSPPWAFTPGEELEFDVDAMGAVAAKLWLRSRAPKNGLWPIEVEAKSNTLFSKVRRVSGGGTSYLNPKTLHPVRYEEDTTENEVRKTAKVQFKPREKKVQIQWTQGEKKGEHQYSYAHNALDLAGAMYLIRHLPMEEGRKLCFDVYGIRRLWRIDAQVLAREHVSLPIGEFEAWHLSGVAIRTDNPRWRRELHIWISDDPRRLPLVAVGVIDLGAVRATLTSFHRPGEKTTRAEGIEDLKW